MHFKVAVTGDYEIKLPQWGRAFWQDPNDGELFLAFASGTSEVDYITSADSGNTWSTPTLLFPVEDFDTHNNFDTFMDRRGHIHCGFRFNGSGCYQFVGKLGGGGWTLSSGLGPVGFNVAGDSGVVKGFDGSLIVQDAPNSFASETVKFPAVKIAAKQEHDAVHAYILGDPYTSVPTQETTSSFDNANFVGSAGGFPVITCNAATVGAPTTSEYYVWSERISEIRGFSKSFGATYGDNTFIVPGSGDVPFGTNMAIGSGFGVAGSDGLVLSCSPSGQSMFMGGGDGFGGFFYQLVTTQYATDLTTNPESNALTDGTDILTWRKIARGPGTSLSGIPYLPAETGVAPTGNIWGVGLNSFAPSGVQLHSFPGGGTNCDWSINENHDIIFYFQTKNLEGRQSIVRVKGSHDFPTPKWTWAGAGHPESGVKYIATASQQFTGGHDNRLFWGGFKSVKHPSEPGDGSNKGEFLVTQGWTSTFPSGGILTVWNVQEAPAVLSDFERPTFSIDYNATSGTGDSIEVFKGITKLENFFFTSHQEQANNIFDADLDTFGNIRDRYVIEVELDKPREINAMEALYITLGRPLEIAVSGSMDQINWSRVAVFPSGRLSQLDNEGSPLYKVASRQETIVDRQNDPATKQPRIDLDPFVAKYVRFWIRSGRGINASERVYDLRLFGPSATEPEIIRYNQDHTGANPHDIRQVRLRNNKATKTETFTGIQEGELPAGWRTYGDFQWAVVSSGDAVLRSNNSQVPPPPGVDGLVPSGMFALRGDARGKSDGFSIRSEAIADASGLGRPLRPVPSGGILPGHSGVLEIDVQVIDNQGSTIGAADNRQISFFIRGDIHRNDIVEFWTLSPDPTDSDNPPIQTLRKTYVGDFFWDNGPFFSVDINGDIIRKQPDTFELDDAWGTHTLRWIYHKGDYDTPEEIESDRSFGACWVDQVSGLDASPINYVRGYLRGFQPSLASGIHGYLEGKGATEIHGFTLGAPWTSQIHGFLSSQVERDAFSQIHGYLFGNLDSSIHGYTLASASGTTTTTFPTGAIHGYVSVPSGANPSIILGYVEGDWGRNIHGYLRGFSNTSGTDASGDQLIHGYLKGFDAASMIHGIVNSSGGQIITDIHGYLKGVDDFQSIHGYVFAPSGATDSRKGVTLGWDQGPSFFRDPQTMIHGFVFKNNLASGSIHGYMLAQFPVESIHGYLGNEALVDSGGGSVGGGPGGGGSSTSNVVPGTNWIHGYLKGFDGDQLIHGYVLATPGAFAERKGYVLAGATDDTIHGYSLGHDVVATGIHGFASGIGFASESIHGWLFGSSGLFDSRIHGFLTGDLVIDASILGYLIGTQSGVSNSQAACLSHNFPLPSVPVVTIPSSCIC